MFKFLLIVGLVLYCIYKIGNLFFRAGAASQQFRERRHETMNADPTIKKEKKGHFKGGDYIDYEEVK
jgi:hypothetical protein